MNRAERRRLMRALGSRRATTKKGRRKPIRPVKSAETAKAGASPYRPEPGVSKTDDGLYVAKGVTVEQLEQLEAGTTARQWDET